MVSGLALVRQRLLAGDLAGAMELPLADAGEALDRCRLLLRVGLRREARELLRELPPRIERRALDIEELMAAALENAALADLTAARSRLGEADGSWRLLQVDALLALRSGNPEAEAIGLEALRCAPPDDHAARAEMHSLLARVATWMGRFERAVSYASSALSYWSALDDRPGQAVTILDLARLQREQGRFDLALDLLSASERIFMAPWDDSGRLERLRIRAECLIQLDRLDEALRDLPRLIGEAEARRDRYLAGVGHMLAAQAHLQRGRLGEAEPALAQAARWLPSGGVSHSRSVHAILANALAFERAADEAALAAAEGAMLEALKEIGRRSVPAEAIRRRMFAARRLAAKGRLETARLCLETALRTAETARLPAAAADVRQLLSELNLGWGVTEETGRSLGGEGWQGAGYVRRALIGKGGFGEVYRAFDIERGREVALKILPLGADWDSRRRQALLQSALNELRASRHLSHPGVARVIAMGESKDDELYVASELIVGEPLSNLPAGLRGFAHLGPLLRDLAEALAALHAAGIVHCDLKPSNVLVRPDRKPVIIDLGISCFKRELRAGSRGTPGYSAPEQARGEAVGPASDLYSFAVLALELLLGTRWGEPGRGFLKRRRALTSLGRLLEQASVPTSVAQLLVRCLAYSPRRRPPDAQSLAMVFRMALTAQDSAEPAAQEADLLPPTDTLVR